MTWRRCLVVLIVAIAGLAAVGVGGAAAFGGWQPRTVAVAGTVATPTTYSLAQLEALPQTSFPVTRWTWFGERTVTDQGVALETLVNDAQPTLPNAKNAQLRVTVTVAGAFGRSVTFALGELDPNFGNHPAYLALEQGGQPLDEPQLVVPGDTAPVRTVWDVNRITVGVQNPTPTTPPAAGDLTIEAGPRTVTLTAAQLAALPSETLDVTFEAGTAVQTHTETGPTLQTVLEAAHVRTDLNTWVAAVGSDGYVATVTPAEAWVGGRPVLISLTEDGVPQTQPRLVTDGDVKGGRYDSGVVDLEVGEGAAGPGFMWDW